MKEQEIDRLDHIESIPFTNQGRKIDCPKEQERLAELWGELKVISQQLIPIHAQKNKLTKKHNGLSLAHTVAKPTKSFHWNSNLDEHAELQERVVRVCIEILFIKFGKSTWYKKLIKSFCADKCKYLLPKTPCTSIWRSCDKRYLNRHTDNNSYGASFVFVPETYKGGEITFEHPDHPDVKTMYSMTEGMVIAGRWDRSPHYSQKFKGDRFVFVMYADKYIMNREPNEYFDKTYKTPAFLRNFYGLEELEYDDDDDSVYNDDDNEQTDLFSALSDFAENRLFSVILRNYFRKIRHVEPYVTSCTTPAPNDRGTKVFSLYF